MSEADFPRDPAAELVDAKAAHKRVLGEIQERMRQLDASWRTARQADRLLAVERTLREATLDPAVHAELEAKNERVRDLMGRARAEKKLLEKADKDPDASDDPQLKHRVLMLDLECQNQERARDEYLDDKGLRDVVYACGESFVRENVYGPEELPLKDLVTRAQALDVQVVKLEGEVGVPRRGATFTARGRDGRERTLIRVLPALTLSGEGVVVTDT